MGDKGLHKIQSFFFTRPDQKSNERETLSKEVNGLEIMRTDRWHWRPQKRTEVLSHGFFTSAIFTGFLASELKYVLGNAYEIEICSPIRPKFARIRYFSGELTKFESVPSRHMELDCQKYHDILLFHIHSVATGLPKIINIVSNSLSIFNF